MPPRLQNQLVSNSLLPYLSSSASTSSCTSLSKLPSSSSYSPQTSCRPFSSTVASQTRIRNEMFQWLSSPQAVNLKSHTPGANNFVLPGNRPFPLNRQYLSESILSEELRNEIYERVMIQKQSVRAVSVDLSVDMRRIGAVIRLVELERRMKKEKKPMALPYARAIHEMVPVTRLAGENGEQRPHESINDLPAHKLTDAQIFYPVSESRHFTRVDAARVFSGAPALDAKQAAWQAKNPYEAVSRYTQRREPIERIGKGVNEEQVLQPADVRIPHPHLIAHQRQIMAHPHELRETNELYKQRLQKQDAAEAKKREAIKARREAQVKTVKPRQSRFEFRFQDAVVSKETVGANGRGHQAPGRRYGVPNQDRRRGQVKIPTRVEV